VCIHGNVFCCPRTRTADGFIANGRWAAIGWNVGEQFGETGIMAARSAFCRRHSQPSPIFATEPDPAMIGGKANHRVAEGRRRVDVHLRRDLHQAPHREAFRIHEPPVHVKTTAVTGCSMSTI
jgi:hypothetical protein